MDLHQAKVAYHARRGPPIKISIARDQAMAWHNTSKWLTLKYQLFDGNMTTRFCHSNTERNSGYKISYIHEKDASTKFCTPEKV